jgi:hypothetical protein
MDVAHGNCVVYRSYVDGPVEVTTERLFTRSVHSRNQTLHQRFVQLGAIHHVRNSWKVASTFSALEMR